MNHNFLIQWRPGNLCLIVTAILLCASCGNLSKIIPNPKSGDQSFVTDLPCKAPCWHNIKLDESSESDVKAVLPNLSFVIKDSVHESEHVRRGDLVDGKEISFKCPEMGTTGYCGGITISDGVVKEIWNLIAYPLTFKAVVEKLGDPTYLTLFPGIEFQHCSVSLYWPEQKIYVSTDEYVDCPTENNIKPETRVNGITYSSLITSWPLKENGGIYIPWAGFSQ